MSKILKYQNTPKQNKTLIMCIITGKRRDLYYSAYTTVNCAHALYTLSRLCLTYINSISDLAV